MISVAVGGLKVRPQVHNKHIANEKVQGCPFVKMSNEIYSTCVELKCIRGERRKKMHGWKVESCLCKFSNGNQLGSIANGNQSKHNLVTTKEICKRDPIQSKHNLQMGNNPNTTFGDNQRNSLLRQQIKMRWKKDRMKKGLTEWRTRRTCTLWTPFLFCK